MTTTNPSEALPPLFAHVLRYSPGDRVHTPFGPGVVLPPSDRKPHVATKLAFGATLYSRRGCLVPEFRMLECGEIPKNTRVLCLPPTDMTTNATTEQATDSKLPSAIVQSFSLRDQQYQVTQESETHHEPPSILMVDKHRLRFAPDTRVRTKLGLGSVTKYRPATDTYVAQLDFSGVGYFIADEVAAVDLRLLSRVPKPMSVDAIYNEFQGRISREDAEQLHTKAQQAYTRIQSLCEQHADAISVFSTNAMYGEQYAQLFSSILDPTLTDATLRLKSAGVNEISKLKALARSAKTSFEAELLDGKDVSTFITQAATVLSKLKDSTEVKDFEKNLRAKASSELENAKQHVQHQDFNQQKLVLSQLITTLEGKVDSNKSRFEEVKNALDRDQILTTLQQHEADLVKAREALVYFEKLASNKLGVDSLMSLEPMQLIAKAEELLPQLTARAELLKVSGEKYLTQLQRTTQGQALFQQAKQLVQSVENPDAFCENVQKAISDVQLDKLAAWGTALTTNRQKRQEFIDRVKDHCLDFFMSVLPTIKVDMLSGIEEGIEYSLSKLDLNNFKVRKERVKVRMGTVADEELFTVRATHLTALLKGFKWTFAQKYFPYAHGGGLADAELTGGVISLGFKAEKKTVNVETGEFKPTLVLNSMEIEIRQELKIAVQGSWFSTIYNLLTSAFAHIIRDYLAKTMESKLLKHMIRLLTTLNEQMEKYWPLVFQLLDIRVEDLPSASAWRGAKEIDIQPHEVEGTFSDRNAVPFTFTKGVLNRYVVVAKLLDKEPMADGSTREVDPELLRVPLGAGVLAINGLACHKLMLDEFKVLLETVPVPFTLRFSLVPEDTSKSRQQRGTAKPEIISVVFKQEGPFGLRLRNRPLAPHGAIVLGFAEPGPGGKKSAAELSGKIQPGQILVMINDVDLRFKQLAEILAVMKETTKRPATLHFASSPDGIIKLREWPPMIEWEQSNEEAADGRNYVEVAAFTRVPSFAQKSHVLKRGDILWKVNDTIMVAPWQANFTGIMDTLKVIADEKQVMRAVFVSKDEYVAKAKTFMGIMGTVPASMTNDTEEKKEDAPLPDEETTNAAVSFDELAFTTEREVVFPQPPFGILFGNWKDEAAFIRVFISSAGPAERSGLINLGQAVLQVCGQNLPLDATPATVEKMIQDGAVARKEPPYTITLRDLDLEREIMKQV